MSEPVVRLRAGGTKVDPYSKKPVDDWTLPPLELPLRALVADSGSVEPLTQDRTPVDSDYTLYFDSDSVDVKRTDRMRVRGDVCTVEGKPFSWQGAGFVVHVKIREG